jgi:hypothetical protein
MLRHSLRRHPESKRLNPSLSLDIFSPQGKDGAISQLIIEARDADILLARKAEGAKNQ